MDLIGAIARPALAWIFVQGGVDALLAPEPRAKMAAPLLDQVRDKAPDAVRDRLPSDEVLVRVNAGVQIAAGAALATGRLPRLSALALIGSLAPTTVGGHPFWRMDDPAQRGPQRIQFAKNVAVIAGLLLAATRLKRPVAHVAG
jgi:uncharacterized membrane protein YphA (DoxX/SURF4 family)